MNRKLGKQPKRHDPRTLMLAAYVGADAHLSAPTAVDYTHGINDWGMFRNDVLGCCTIAGVAHAEQLWSVNTLGRETTITDDDVVRYYSLWDGYQVGNPATDNGGVELAVLNQWRQAGFNGHKLDAFAAVNITQAHVQLSTWLFGATYIGVELPAAAQGEELWALPATLGPDDEPGSWGGHCVVLAKYDAEGPTCITWGGLRKMTWAWFEKYCTEAYGLVSADWLTTSGLAPSGFNMLALENDLKAVTA